MYTVIFEPGLGLLCVSDYISKSHTSILLMDLHLNPIKHGTFYVISASFCACFTGHHAALVMYYSLVPRTAWGYEAISNVCIYSQQELCDTHENAS